jgi:hypothetical protein
VSAEGQQGGAAAPNAIQWGTDNCQYQWNGRQWQPLDICRVMKSATVYDTYKRSTRQWLARYDESEPGWIGAMALNTPGAYQLKFSTTRTAVFAFVNGRWVDVTAQAFPAQRPVANPRANNPTLAGCPAEIPMYRPMTPLEKRCNEAMVAHIVTMSQGAAVSRSCEQRRAAGPYAGMTAQQREDHRRQGQLADGWVDTAAGPMLKGC